MPFRDSRADDPLPGIPSAGAAVAGSLLPLQTVLFVLGTADLGLGVAFTLANALVPAYFFGAPVVGGLAGYWARRDGADIDGRFLRSFVAAGVGWYGLAVVGALVLAVVGATLVSGVELVEGTAAWARALGRAFSPAALFVATGLLGGFVGAIRHDSAAGAAPTRATDRRDAREDLDAATAEALDRLRERYAEGHVTEAELERRTEAILDAAEGVLDDPLEADLDAGATVEGGPTGDIDPDPDVDVDVEADGVDAPPPSGGDGATPSDGEAADGRSRERTRERE